MIKFTKTPFLFVMFILFMFSLLLSIRTVYASSPGASVFGIGPEIEWSKAYGGSKSEYFPYAQPTTDGGCIVAGFTGSNDGDILHNNGKRDAWILKLDQNGNIQWNRTYGGPWEDHANSVQQTEDGGYIVVGTISAIDRINSQDYWILKLDRDGNIQWSKTYGSLSSGDEAFFVQQTRDGGYIVGGQADGGDGDVRGYHKNGDYWLIKLDRDGNIQWSRAYGGTYTELFFSVNETQGGGYIITGSSISRDGDVICRGGLEDYAIIKVSPSGNLEWGRSYGGSGTDIARYGLPTKDGGYIIVGWTDSNDGDILYNHGEKDVWILKLDEGGHIQWSKTYGGSGPDFGFAIQQTKDEGYVVAAMEASFDGDLLGSKYTADYWIFKIDPFGNMVWSKTYGSIGGEMPQSIAITKDGGYLIGGTSDNEGRDVPVNHGLYDYWILKLKPFDR